MSTSTPQGRPLKQEIAALMAAKRTLQVESRKAPQAQKEFFSGIIKGIDREMQGKQEEFTRFVDTDSVTSLELLTADFVDSPFTAELYGTVTIEIDHDNGEIRGPHTVTFSPEDDTPTLRLRFDQTTVEVDELTPVETDPHDTPVGTNTTTVSRVVNDGRRTGTFDRESGHIELPLNLFFDNSVSAPRVETDAPVNFDLSTHGVTSPVGSYQHVDLDGAPLDPETMAFKVVDESMFEDISGRLEWSFLGGKNVVLSAEGELTNIEGPPLDVPSSISFGQVVVGDLRTRTLSIENNTGSNVVLSVPNSPDPPTGPGAPGIPTFSWSPTGRQLLRRGELLRIQVTFAPGANEQAQMTLTITGNDSGSPHSVSLRGTGIGGPGGGNGGGPGNGGIIHPP